MAAASGKKLLMLDRSSAEGGDVMVGTVCIAHGGVSYTVTKNRQLFSHPWLGWTPSVVVESERRARSSERFGQPSQVSRKARNWIK